jgi:hypothetical protein
MRAMVRGLVPKASTISSSARSFPSVASARRRMRALVRLRAADLPAEIRHSNATRFSAISITR